MTTLPPNQVTLPGRWDSLWWRGNAWSVTIPGLPWLPGLTSSLHPERCLTWFFGHPLWKDWEDQILYAHAIRGYTHFTLSWPDARRFWGATVQDFVATCAKVRSWGFDVHVMLGSKYDDPQDQTWDGYWNGAVTPVMQAMTAAGVVQHVCPAWEFNFFNIPGDVTQGIIDGVSGLAQPFGVHTWMHFSTEVTWWGAAGDDRFQWWARQVGKLAGILYQADGYWTMGDRQARFADTTNRVPEFMDGRLRFVQWEADGDRQFDGDYPDENESDMRSYIGICAPGAGAISGFGGGCRLPDGTETLKG